MVIGALRNFDSQRYQPFGYVVMNDHVHVAVNPAAGFSTKKRNRHGGRRYGRERVTQRAGVTAPSASGLDSVHRSEPCLRSITAYGPSCRMPTIRSRQAIPLALISGLACRLVGALACFGLLREQVGGAA